MKSIVYRGNTPFIAAFISEANATASTLKFTTREEYLSWVAKWKEEYKLVERKHKIDNLCSKRDRCVLQHKIDHYQKMLDKLSDLTEAEKAKYNEIVGRLSQSIWMTSWMSGNSYWIVIALLIERKAGKIKANVQRNLRLLEQKQVV